MPRDRRPPPNRLGDPILNPETVRQLLGVNRRFYERFADSFSASRQRPWRGWERVLGHLPAGPLSILDIGCGNARLATFLADRAASVLRRYVGLDGNANLLADAAARLAKLDGTACRLERFELVRQRPAEALGNETFDLIALFGVLHHLPGVDTRRRLVADLGRHLRPAGILAATLWRLDRSPSFAAKTLDWRRFNRQRSRARSGQDACAIDLDQLETGDHLVTWNRDSLTPRYCHFVDEGEVAELVRESGLRLVERFDADGPGGRDNHYLLLRT